MCSNWAVLLAVYGIPVPATLLLKAIFYKPTRMLGVLSAHCKGKLVKEVLTNVERFSFARAQSEPYANERFTCKVFSITLHHIGCYAGAD